MEDTVKNSSILASLVIVAQRHGNASKGKDDFSRPLSEKGVRQLSAARPAIEALGPFDLVVTSPAVRARSTVEHGNVLTVHLDALYFPAEGSVDRLVIDTVYDRIGNAPLEEHLASEAGPALLRWVMGAVQAVIDEALRIGPSKRVLVGGHGVYTQMLMLQLALLMGVDVTPALTISLVEGDALVLDQKNGLRHLACPKVEG